MNNTITGIAWELRKAVAQELGKADIGVGDRAVKATGLAAEEIGRRVAMIFHDLCDGGAAIILIENTPLYTIRRHCWMVDVGTREDMAEFGVGFICDMLDAKLEDEKAGGTDG